MDAELAQKTSSLMGCIYYVPPPSCNDKSADGTAECNAMRFLFNPALASTSSTPKLSPAILHDAKLLARAVHIGFSCLVGDSGESMVPSAPVLSRFQIFHSTLNMPPPQFLISYPTYNSCSSSRVPLVFPAEVAYYSQKCEVCIMKPMNRPFVSTRCLDFSFEPHLKHKDPVFCFFFSESECDTFVVDGQVSSLPPNPCSYGLIAEFPLALSLRAGVVFDVEGRIVGTHVCDFTIEEGDDHGSMSVMTRRANAVARVEIKDNVEPVAFGRACKVFEGMPPAMLNQVQDSFVSSSKHRKQAAQQSRIYMLNQASKKLFFFNKRSSLLSSLIGLMVRNEDTYEEPLWLSRGRSSMRVEEHKRRRLWHVVARTKFNCTDYNDDDNDDDNEDGTNKMD